MRALRSLQQFSKILRLQLPSAGATGSQRPVRPGDWVQGEAKGGVEDAGGQLEHLVLKNEKKLGGAVGVIKCD